MLKNYGFCPRTLDTASGNTGVSAMVVVRVPGSKQYLAEKLIGDQAAAEPSHVGREERWATGCDQAQPRSERGADREVVRSEEEDHISLLTLGPAMNAASPAYSSWAGEGGRFVNRMRCLRQHTGDHLPGGIRRRTRCGPRLAGEIGHAHQLQRAFDDGGAVGLPLHAPVQLNRGPSQRPTSSQAGWRADPVSGDETGGGGPLVGSERCQRQAQSSIFPAAVAPSPARPGRVLLPVPLRPIRAVSRPLFEQAGASSNGVRLTIWSVDTHVRRCCSYGRRHGPAAGIPIRAVMVLMGGRREAAMRSRAAGLRR